MKKVFKKESEDGMMPEAFIIEELNKIERKRPELGLTMPSLETAFAPKIPQTPKASEEPESTVIVISL